MSKELKRLANITAVELYGSTLEKQLSGIPEKAQGMFIVFAAKIGQGIEDGTIDVDKAKQNQT